MAERLDTKNIVKHLAYGTLCDLCLICLTPLKETTFESIFTLLCKEKTEYCIADALEAVCQFQFDGIENHNICIDCFKAASEAYNFHLKAKRSKEIIMHYARELSINIKNVQVTNVDVEKLLCIPLSDYVPETSLLNFSLDGVGKKHADNNDDNYKEESIKRVYNEENIVGVVKDDSDAIAALHFMNSESEEDEDMVMIINEKKERKKRDPMVYMSCSRCPIKYRFVSKLKSHMKIAHDIEIYYCKICKIISENKEEYEKHLKIHRGKHQCAICNFVYKKAETLVQHMKLHESEKDFHQYENANICELCGAVLEDESSLQEHMSSKHVKKYTCYYCGKMYKVEGSFESHIKKHEAYWKKKNGTKEQASTKPAEDQADKQDKSKRSFCQTCGKDFVDERSLLWHQRLHNNDRPYKCEVCGRGFVSKNRRNQHSTCAHTPPARRCPLCPALFHLRSMVNTHVRKVHLKTHKRRNRTSKHANVCWRTEPVPIQELSVDVQNDILELQATRAD